MRKLFLTLVLLLAATPASAADRYTLIGWNDLGMHCTDGVDYSVFGILPPYNTIDAQLVTPQGKLVRAPAGITVTLEAVADTRGSINTTSVGKTNFWQYINALFGVSLPPDAGLAGMHMPGTSNTPQHVRFDAARGWFTAEGVPITPFDDRGARNFYPMLRLVARDSSGAILASTDVVAPVSDEMDCRACHASGSAPAARPGAGWAWDADPGRDVKLNVLAIHDEHQAANAAYINALAALGYNSAGLRATSQGGTPILCARCHSSNALPGLGIAGIQPLTQAIHARHTDAVDPTNGLRLGESANRVACYRCHPGSETKCLRGVMGNSVASNGDYAIQCQSCHGSMSDVGEASRKGWLEEPTCQSCHTDSTRYTTVFSSPGVVRVPGDMTFATNANQPATGLSLYRFSSGHGGMKCEACHGSTHAEFASTEANDNAQSVRLQGHAGMLAECTACHPSMPETASGGPHGLHEIGSSWVGRHGDVAEQDHRACRACHGSDDHGSPLSRALGDRAFSTDFGSKAFWRGFQIGCYTCHDGPDSEHATGNRAPVVQNASASTTAATRTAIALHATDADANPLRLRVVSQPAHGRAGIASSTATYVSDPGFAGTDTFTYAANDGSTDSNLASVHVTVSAVASIVLSVAKEGTGAGLVTSAPAGINCGPVCQASFVAGSQVVLRAQPDAGSRFDGWSGPCSGTGTCTLTLGSTASVTARFTAAPASYTLTVAKSGLGTGTVTSSPQRIACGSQCAGSFGAGTAVTLTAVAGPRSVFSGWSGACSGTGVCRVTMDSDKSVTALFGKSRRRAAGK